MTLSIWRFAHLALAFVSAVFLLILSVTGVILAYDAAQEKTYGYRVDNFDDITLAQSIEALRESYFEILEVSVDHNDFVIIDAMDENGSTIKSYINPLTGEQLGKVEPKSQFIQWNTALHRSLFLKEPGRAIVGVVSFLLFLITISGFVLILKRQNGIRNFWAKVNKDFFWQYFHVVSGRLMLVPILIIALTGTIIFMVRLDFMQQDTLEISHEPITEESVMKEIQDIEFFKNTKLADVKKIEFPFIADDPAEPFIITLSDRIVSVNQVNGDLMHESKLPYTVVLENLNIDLHTGRTNIIWAIVLGLASLNILFFMYSGFVITYKRTRNKVKNKYKADEAEIIILFGSENGTTLFFANQIHNQLLSSGKRSYLTEMDKFTTFNKARHLLIFTSTYGVGEPPSNAKNFMSLVDKLNQDHEIMYSVVGFGSRAYKDFCAFAIEVNDKLVKKSWAKQLTPLYLVNDRSGEDFVKWAVDWSESSEITIATAPAIYNNKVPGLQKFKVLDKTLITNDNSTFKITLEPKRKLKFTSGDLLAIYPGGDNRERFYSVGKNQNNVQLIVKLFDNGFGSGYLYNLDKGATIEARIMNNPSFHLPKNSSPVIMIANGTGIAPFLGMISENLGKTPIRLYAGFRYNNSLIKQYREFADIAIKNGMLQQIDFAFSREENKQYVMDLIDRDQEQIAVTLKNGGVIMICGALAMQKDVEIVLDKITSAYNNEPLENYKNNNQILTDCY